MSYVKVFGEILDSSVWGYDSDTRIVWITLLCMKDSRGKVEASVSGIARRAIVPLDKATEAIKRFESPDPESRSQEYDGRRIRKVDGGWQVLNHLKYRNKESSNPIPLTPSPVSPLPPSPPPPLPLLASSPSSSSSLSPSSLPKTDTDQIQIEDKSLNNNETNITRARGLGYELPFKSEAFAHAWLTWLDDRRRRRILSTPKSVELQFKDLIAWGEAKAIQSIEQSIKRGYQGLFEPRDDDMPSFPYMRPLKPNETAVLAPKVPRKRVPLCPKLTDDDDELAVGYKAKVEQ